MLPWKEFIGGVVRADRSAGIRFLNDPDGVVLPYLGRLRLGMAQRFSSVEQDQDMKRLIDEEVYDLGEIYDPDAIDTVRDYFESWLADDVADIDRVGGVEVRRSAVVDPDMEVLQPLLNHPELQRIVRSYFGTEFKAGFAAVIKNSNLSEDELKKVKEAKKSLTWHVGDIHPPNGIRLQVLLTDQEDKGALYAVSHTETRRLFKEKDLRFLKENPDYVMKNADVKTFYGKKGAARLFDSSRQLHRGEGPAENNERMIVIFELQPDYNYSLIPSSAWNLL